MNKKQAMQDRIEAHGADLLRLFPNATERDPASLCKKLRRIEGRANRAACDACNTQHGADAWPKIKANTERAVLKLLNTDRVWINGDPRGYALKVDLRPGESLHRDLGGYGIIAPDLSES